LSLIVFDLDGTLIDSRKDLSDSANEMLAGYGASPLDEPTIGRMIGNGAAELVRRALAASGASAPLDAALQRFRDIYDRRLIDATRPYDGIVELLETLRQRRLSLGLLTNKPLSPSLRILDAFGLTDYFPLRVGGDGPWPRKPAAEGIRFLMTAAESTPDDTLLVGDSIIDVRTARNARVPICIARYGFGFFDLPPAELTGDELIVDRPAELLPVLDRLERFQERE
jgi:phosphoglycolate phosphatase